MTTVNTIVTTVLEHIGALEVGQTAGAADADKCLRALVSMLDAWQLDPQAVIGRQEVTRTPVAGTQSFTIGTGGDLSSVIMPTRIEAAYRRVSGLDTPIEVRPLETYLAEGSKTVQGPTQYIALEKSYGVGTVYLYPAADGATELHLWVNRQVVSGFSSLVLATDMTLPNGMQSALEWCVAEQVAPDFAVPDRTMARVNREAARAYRRIKRSNVRVPVMSMPSGVPVSGSFNINEG